MVTGITARLYEIAVFQMLHNPVIAMYIVSLYLMGGSRCP